jgi:hypothetical protein
MSAWLTIPSQSPRARRAGSGDRHGATMSACGAVTFVRVLSQGSWREVWRCSRCDLEQLAVAEALGGLGGLGDDCPGGLHEGGQDVEVLEVAQQPDLAFASLCQAIGMQVGVRPPDVVDAVDRHRKTSRGGSEGARPDDAFAGQGHRGRAPCLQQGSRRARGPGLGVESLVIPRHGSATDTCHKNEA